MTENREYQRIYLDNARQAMKQSLPSGSRPLLFITLMVIVGFLIWAGISEIDEVTRGNGKVVPSSRVQTIQNLEGGIISEIKVAEGDAVVPGQVLLLMDDTRFNASMQEQQAVKNALLARKTRLQAEVDGSPFTVATELALRAPEMVVLERKLFLSRQEEQQHKQAILQQQLLQQQQQREELQAKSALLKRRTILLEEEQAIARKLAKSGAVPRVEVLRIERQVSDTRGEKLMAAKGQERMKAVMRETEEKLQELPLAFTNQAREELNDTRAKLNELQASSTAITDRVERTRVRSPVNGVVNAILVNTRGGVVQPGMPMMEIVPLNDRLQVEVRIRPEDIGFLHPGQKAVVRFTAYDFTIYGGLDGQLAHISADTTQDENGDSFYLARVETESSNLDKTGDSRPVISGMVATVDIMTGKKTLLSYLLKPVLRAKQLAFSER